MSKPDPRLYHRPGSLAFQLASLKVGEHILQQVEGEGVQARQSMNMAAITRHRKFPGCENWVFTQRVFYAINPDAEEIIKIVRITRVEDKVPA